MAYRGRGLQPVNSNKRVNMSPPKTSGFDAKFSDFDSFTTTPPSSKKPRINPRVKQFIAFKNGVCNPPVQTTAIYGMI